MVRAKIACPLYPPKKNICGLYFSSSFRTFWHLICFLRCLCWTWCSLSFFRIYFYYSSYLFWSSLSSLLSPFYLERGEKQRELLDLSYYRRPLTLVTTYQRESENGDRNGKVETDHLHDPSIIQYILHTTTKLISSHCQKSLFLPNSFNPRFKGHPKSPCQKSKWLHDKLYFGQTSQRLDFHAFIHFT